VSGTKRRRIAPRRIGQTPLWARRLMAGQLPPNDTDEHAELVGWLYFGEEIPGLPPGDSADAWHIWNAAKGASLARD
jgi:hypothetical protein